MAEPMIPDPDDELENLAPLIPILFEGFEAATEKASQFFESQSKPVNSALYPTLVRYYMREHLKDKGQVVDEFDREEIFNNGLCVTYGVRRIRMWKAYDDTIPPPGSSFTKQSFLGQQLAMSLFGDNPKPIELNLVILWNVNSHYRLSGLYLACPKSALHNGAAAEAYWSRPIPHPAESLVDTHLEPKSESSKDLPIEVSEVEVDDSKRAQ